jgi:hypothetical protein
MHRRFEFMIIRGLMGEEWEGTFPLVQKVLFPLRVCDIVFFWSYVNYADSLVCAWSSHHGATRCETASRYTGDVSEKMMVCNLAK